MKLRLNEVLRVVAPLGIIYLIQTQFSRFPGLLRFIAPFTIISVTILVMGFLATTTLTIMRVQMEHRKANLPYPSGTDISATNPPPPENMRSLLADLGQAGFTRFGEAEFDDPGETDAKVSWYFIDGTKTVVAIASSDSINNTSHITLSTVFESGDVLQTHFPVNWLSSDAPPYYVISIKGGVFDAYPSHVLRVTHLKEKHGSPKLFETLQERLLFMRDLNIKNKAAIIKAYDKMNRNNILKSSLAVAIYVALAVFSIPSNIPIIAVALGLFALVSAYSFWKHAIYLTRMHLALGNFPFLSKSEG
jgi:hypothetical protein